MTDPLASWWVHPVVVERYASSGAYGPSYAAPQTIHGFVRDGTKLVVGPGGQQIASSAQIALPRGTQYVPVDSKVTLPAVFGGRTSTVVSCDVADGGGQPTPDYVQLTLL